MRIQIGSFTGLSLAAILGLVLTFQLGARNKPAKAPKMANIQGNVQMIDKGTMTISVRTSNAKKDVIYSADTKFLAGHSKDNKPGTVDEVKDNFFISCTGTYATGKVRLMAKECVYRATK